MKTNRLLRSLAKYFPKRIKSPGDHIGLMTGKLKEETKKILLCLDFDDEVMKSVPDIMPDLILTHHPFIYGTKRRVFKNDKIKEDLCDRIDKLDIPVYSMHTNFDTGYRGMNDALTESLGLVDVHPLIGSSMARGGKLPQPMEIHEFAKYVNQKFNLPYSHLIHKGKDIIETVAIIGGGGSYHYLDAINENYDIYLSGDAPHHLRRDIVNNKYNYLDVMHEIERIFMKQMKKILLEIDPSLEITIIDHEEWPELIQ